VDYPSVRLIAKEDDEIVGYARAVHQPFQPEGEFFVAAAVIESHRGQGIGRMVYDEAEAFVASNGGRKLSSQVRDDDEASLEVAKKFGYRMVRHEFEGRLDVQEFDESPFEGIVERLEREGVRFVSFADTDRSEKAKRMLHAINVEVVADVPGAGDDFDWPYDHFCRSVFQARWFRPEGQIMAMVGDEPVGLGAVGEVAPRKFYNMITGVSRNYRGRGIATALKVLCTRAARDLGASEIFTNNDSNNLPMIEVNRKFGYVRCPGLFKLCKELKTAR